ncbi:MAG: TetR/AcrR family transcriptional regulator [Gemmatimonadales bacterium]|jgi:TetR/AcrR family transcriptional regulator|nr:MAG: TetR/AcrR family transcriptional regulator [Gemmatimonadales bacterium]
MDMKADPTHDSRTSILDAAELLFARRGFQSTTIKAIAGAAGVNTALLYYYFPDKQGLYHAVLERAFGGLILEGEDRLAGALDPEQAVRAFVALQAAYFGRHPNRPHLFVRELLDHGAEHAAGQLTRLAATLFRRLHEIIERGQAAGQFRPDLEPRRAAISVISQLAWFQVARPAIGILVGAGTAGPSSSWVDEFSMHAADFAVSALRPTRTPS